MVKRINFIFLIGFLPVSLALAQESSTPEPSQNEIVSATPTPVPISSPSPTPSAARAVSLKFVPPPMEGTVSLGIFDSNDKLVRVLHRQSSIDTFTIDENSLNTIWDGKNDSGADSPPGKYRARGYLVAHFKVENLGSATAPTEASDHVAVKLVTNPLISDTRSVLDVATGFDAKGSFLKTMDGLPLFSLAEAPNLVRVVMTKAGDKSIDVWEDNGSVCQHVRVSNIDKMMAFDCGYFDLK